MTDTVAPTAPAAPVADTAAPVAPAAPAAPETWYSKAADDVRGYVEMKGWKDPFEVVTGYKNLEKLVGLPADQILRMPKADDAEGVMKVFDKLGRPAKADDYGLKAPEGVSENFVKNASAWFHEIGLTKNQASKLVEKLGADVAQTRQAAAEAEALQVKEGAEKINKEWGAALEKNKAIVDGVAREFGMSAEQVLGLRKALGVDGAMNFLYSIGKKLGEDTFVAQNGGPKGFGQAMTPGEAKARIESLRSDPEFAAKYANGGAKEKEEMDRLHQFAYPEPRAA